jgi:hypothetical protein
MHAFGTRAIFGIVILWAAAPAIGQEIVAETPKSQIPIDRTPIVEAPIKDADRAHWAFQPIRRPELPLTQARSASEGTQRSEVRSQNAIDEFIAAKLIKSGLGLSPEATNAMLLRRLSFDLIGLPPTPEELTAFENDASPDAYDRRVDRLLASPAVGERWGQYWLDLARFAETDGYEHDKVRPDAWRYRDWVIAALNADMPYDEFIRQQIAGDEQVQSPKSKVPSQDDEASTVVAFDPKSKIQNPKSALLLPGDVATMFTLAGPDMPDVNDQAERRHVLLNEMTATVGSAFLGLQLGCAQCHDHKYDPLSQGDFYRLRAVFEPAVATLKRDVPFNVLVNQKDATPARLWIRGDYRRPGIEVEPAFPRIAAIAPTRSVSEGQTDHGKNPSLMLRVGVRSELASWLVSPDNPLTSRVIVNRLWHHHFGRGICQTPSDFGVMGYPVTHPELLDWLAIELREGAWGMKRVHRTIVSSATYRQKGILDFGLQILDSKISESTSPKSTIQNPKSIDADNSLYSRFPRRRLEGEAIRDAMLAVAGLLSSERGGPGVMPPLPDELLGTLLKGQWAASKREADHYKRSVYVFARRNLRYPIFEAFDRPDGNASCPVRSRSTTAPQSLLLFNSELSLLAARHLAGRVLSASEENSQFSIPAQIDRLYRIALARGPTKTELQTLEAFLAEQRQRLAAEARPRDQLVLPAGYADSADPFAGAALVDACLAMLNSNEFIYVD